MFSDNPGKVFQASAVYRPFSERVKAPAPVTAQVSIGDVGMIRPPSAQVPDQQSLLVVPRLNQVLLLYDPIRVRAQATAGTDEQRFLGFVPHQEPAQPTGCRSGYA